METEFYGQWECLSDHYQHIKKGQRIYPDRVSDSWVVVYIEEAKGRLWYLKENFRECINDYDPTQMGDKDDDI